MAARKTTPGGSRAVRLGSADGWQPAPRRAVRALKILQSIGPGLGRVSSRRTAAGQLNTTLSAVETDTAGKTPCFRRTRQALTRAACLPWKPGLSCPSGDCAVSGAGRRDGGAPASSDASQVGAQRARQTALLRRLLAARDRLRRLRVQGRRDSRRATPVRQAGHDHRSLDLANLDLDGVGDGDLLRRLHPYAVDSHVAGGDGVGRSGAGLVEPSSPQPLVDPHRVSLRQARVNPAPGGCSGPVAKLSRS